MYFRPNNPDRMHPAHIRQMGLAPGSFLALWSGMQNIPQNVPHTECRPALHTVIRTTFVRARFGWRGSVGRLRPNPMHASSPMRRHRNTHVGRRLAVVGSGVGPHDTGGPGGPGCPVAARAGRTGLMCAKMESISRISRLVSADVHWPHWQLHSPQTEQTIATH